MKKYCTKISTFIIGSLLMLMPLLSTGPVFADDGDNCVDTTFFGRQCGSAGIISVLKVIVNVMSAGIVALAIVGIVISGVQYLTAGGNEEQIKKSKRRIFEIVIGIAAYALLYGFLSWLLPDFPS